MFLVRIKKKKKKNFNQVVYNIKTKIKIKTIKIL